MIWKLNQNNHAVDRHIATIDWTDLRAADPGAADLTDLKDLLNLMPPLKSSFKTPLVPLEIEFK